MVSRLDKLFNHLVVIQSFSHLFVCMFVCFVNELVIF